MVQVAFRDEIIPEEADKLKGRKTRGEEKRRKEGEGSASLAVSGNDKYNRLVASVHVIRCVSFTVTHLSRKRQGIITENVRAKE